MEEVVLAVQYSDRMGDDGLDVNETVDDEISVNCVVPGLCWV